MRLADQRIVIGSHSKHGRVGRGYRVRSARPRFPASISRFPAAEFRSRLASGLRLPKVLELAQMQGSCAPKKDHYQNPQRAMETSRGNLIRALGECDGGEFSETQVFGGRDLEIQCRPIDH